MKTHALITVKRATGKSRLAAVLSVPKRERLVTTMFEDVLAAVRDVREFDEIVILTGDSNLVPADCRCIADAGGGINAEVTRAARQLEREDVECIAVLAADLPFVTSEDIRALLAPMAHRVGVMAPDHTARGSNALVLTPPTLFEPRFGPHSARHHRAAAAQADVTFVQVTRAGLAHDIDAPSDLPRLISRDGDRYAFLADEPEARAPLRGHRG